MDNRFPFDYQINNSKRAKNIRITIKPGKKVILTKPWIIPQYIAIQFLKKNKKWVEEKLKKVPTKIPNKNTIYYLGEKYKLEFTKGKVNFQISGKTLTITSPTKKAGLRALLTRLKKEARYNIKVSAKNYSKKMNQKFNTIKLKDQSTRWGSASSKNNLNFNWRLIMAPPKVLNYVVIHELAHFKHMDHSRNFWHFVEKFDSEYREHRRWLTRHQSDLIFPT